MSSWLFLQKHDPMVLPETRATENAYGAALGIGTQKIILLRIYADASLKTWKRVQRPSRSGYARSIDSSERPPLKLPLTEVLTHN